MSEENDPTPFPGHKITFPEDGKGLGCSACGRRGYALSNPCPAEAEPERRFVKCSECNGLGEVYDNTPCSECDGTGNAEEEVYPVTMADLET